MYDQTINLTSDMSQYYATKVSTHIVIYLEPKTMPENKQNLSKQKIHAPFSVYNSFPRPQAEAHLPLSISNRGTPILDP
jgi:hypothetical protein